MDFFALRSFWAAATNQYNEYRQKNENDKNTDYERPDTIQFAECAFVFGCVGRG